MTIDEADAVVDQLNAVFAKKSTNIPSAQSIREALEAFNANLKKFGFDPAPIPEEISGTENHLDRDVAAAVDAIRNYAKQVISAATLKAELEELLSKIPQGTRKIKI